MILILLAKPVAFFPLCSLLVLYQWGRVGGGMNLWMFYICKDLANNAWGIFVSFIRPYSMQMSFITNSREDLWVVTDKSTGRWLAQLWRLVMPSWDSAVSPSHPPAPHLFAPLLLLLHEFLPQPEVLRSPHHPLFGSRPCKVHVSSSWKASGREDTGEPSSSTA